MENQDLLWGGCRKWKDKFREGPEELALVKDNHNLIAQGFYLICEKTQLPSPDFFGLKTIEDK